MRSSRRRPRPIRPRRNSEPRSKTSSSFWSRRRPPTSSASWASAISRRRLPPSPNASNNARDVIVQRWFGPVLPGEKADHSFFLRQKNQNLTLCRVIEIWSIFLDIMSPCRRVVFFRFDQPMTRGAIGPIELFSLAHVRRRADAAMDKHRNQNSTGAPQSKLSNTFHLHITPKPLTKAIATRLRHQKGMPKINRARTSSLRSLSPPSTPAASQNRLPASDSVGPR